MKMAYLKANDGWRSAVMDYDSAWRYAEFLHRLGNYNIRVMKVRRKAG